MSDGELETPTFTAYMLLNKTKKAEKIEDIPITDDEFTYNHQTYNVEANEIFEHATHSLKDLIPHWFPRVNKSNEQDLRAYYQAGRKNPLSWRRPVDFGASDLYVAQKEETSWVDMFKIGGGSNSSLGWALIAGVVVIGIIAILYFLPKLTGGGLPGLIG